MKILIVPLIFFVISVAGQDKNEDFQAIKLKASQNQTDQKKYRGLLKLYKNHVSDQILNDCIYQESCSEFSQGAIGHYGVIKGVFLTADRLMRCNRASAINIAPVRFTNDNKIKDPWEAYTFKH